MSVISSLRSSSVTFANWDGSPKRQFAWPTNIWIFAKFLLRTTAYGATVTVPEGVDILIAGFSCVDFSALNCHRKNINDFGESGETFWAIMRYARRHRPALIVLENVLQAPWPRIKELWEEMGYVASHMRLDTKSYYIPHTRMRGYMLCVNVSTRFQPRAAKASVKRWEELMKVFRRPASSSVEAFLLNEDDPRLLKARVDMAKDSRGDDKAAKEVAWVASQARHERVRKSTGLGTQKPCTRWVDNGSNVFHEYGWGDWSRNQVDRIKDSFEIHYLRGARRGYDASYKP